MKLDTVMRVVVIAFWIWVIYALFSEPSYSSDVEEQLQLSLASQCREVADYAAAMQVARRKGATKADIDAYSLREFPEIPGLLTISYILFTTIPETMEPESVWSIAFEGCTTA